MARWLSGFRAITACERSPKFFAWKDTKGTIGAGRRRLREIGIGRPYTKCSFDFNLRSKSYAGESALRLREYSGVRLGCNSTSGGCRSRPARLWKCGLVRLKLVRG